MAIGKIMVIITVLLLVGVIVNGVLLLRTSEDRYLYGMLSCNGIITILAVIVNLFF